MHVLYASRIIRTGLSIFTKTELLSFEELERLAKLFVGRFGVEKIRLTGGEPLMRKDMPELIKNLRASPDLKISR